MQFDPAKATAAFSAPAWITALLFGGAVTWEGVATLNNNREALNQELPEGIHALLASQHDRIREGYREVLAQE
jgi:hypothetical protein